MSKLSKFYDKKKSEDVIRNRYKNCIPSIRLTLDRLVKDVKFQQTIEILRQKKWKDWHLLLAIFNHALNYRGNFLGVFNNPFAMKRFSDEYPYQEETKNSIPIPLQSFSIINLEMALHSSMMATLKQYGFSLKGKHLKIDDVVKLLDEKFNYWSEDIDHDNIFDF